MQVQRSLSNHFGERADFVVIAAVASVVISIVAKSILGLAVCSIALAIGFIASKIVDSAKQSFARISHVAHHRELGNLGVNS